MLGSAGFYTDKADDWAARVASVAADTCVLTAASDGVRVKEGAAPPWQMAASDRGWTIQMLVSAESPARRGEARGMRMRPPLRRLQRSPGCTISCSVLWPPQCANSYAGASASSVNMGRHSL